MCAGLFYLAQEKFIQAEMAFVEATKQQRAALECSRSEKTTKTVCDSNTHSEDNELVDEPGELFLISLFSKWYYSWALYITDLLIFQISIDVRSTFNEVNLSYKKTCEA